MSSPAISVVMSVYNGERFLKEAVDSILNQSFRDFEFIIINDGSQDSSNDMLRTYAGQDSRIILVEQPNRGLVASLNHGLAIARAALIARMDADDISEPCRLKLQKDYMDAHPDIGVLGTDMVLIDEHGEQIKKCFYPRKGAEINEFIQKRGSPLAHPSVMMRKDLILNEGGYRKAYRHAEDYDLWLRLHKVTSFDNLPFFLLRYRQHNNKVSYKYSYEQGLATVIARMAAKANPDPTEGLESLSYEDLKKFPGDHEKSHLEILEISANSLLYLKDKESLNFILSKLKTVFSKESKKVAARIYIKCAYAFLRMKDYKNFLKCFGYSLFRVPLETFSFIFKKIFHA